MTSGNAQRLTVATPVKWQGVEWKVDRYIDDASIVLVRWIDDAAPGWSTRIAEVADIEVIADDAAVPDDFPLLW